jgi:hypothetical protein
MDVLVLEDVSHYFFFGTISRIICHNYNYGLCDQFHEKKVDIEEYRYKHKGNV